LIKTVNKKTRFFFKILANFFGIKV